ncbi:MAG: class I SAM-dependent methyltransferase, partial [Caulobacterales bacterium]|nr:class I SAM-dependent methyltransferase [Caulobacterales bacterium]
MAATTKKRPSKKKTSAKTANGARRSAGETAPAYDGPPDYRAVGRHDVFPDVSHDEAARYNFVAQLNRHLSTRVLPGVVKAHDVRVAPAHKRRAKRAFADRHEVRRALLKDPMFQWWSALRRSTMEMRQQAGRWNALRQADALTAKVDALTRGDERLALDPKIKPPRYVSAVDHHIMPGSYHTELRPGDVTVAASYDSGLFCTTGGMLGRFSDGGGQAVVKWLADNRPDFKPKRILDMGCTLGHNVLPIAEAYPDAEIIAVDVGAPMLRYGLARAKSLG